MRMNLMIAVLVATFIFLQVRLWFQPDGIRDMMSLKQQIASRVAENDNLRRQNEKLLFQVHRLQHSQDATESRARNELGMIKKDETFYQIVKGK